MIFTQEFFQVTQLSHSNKLFLTNIVSIHECITLIKRYYWTHPYLPNIIYINNKQKWSQIRSITLTIRKVVSNSRRTNLNMWDIKSPEIETLLLNLAIHLAFETTMQRFQFMWKVS